MERKLTANKISFTKHDNVFFQIEDWKRAQKLADRFAGLGWPQILERYARFVNPLLKGILHGYRRYWVTSQSEYSTDIAFKSSADLRDLFPRLLSHGTLCFGAKDVMSFLGKKLRGQFLGEIVSYAKDGAWLPICREDIQLFKAMMAGEHNIRGLSNVDIRSLLDHTPHLRELAHNPRKQSAKVSRILSRFHAHKLIAKIPHTRRWRVTDRGKQIMSASLCIRDVAFPELFRKNAA